MDPPQDRLVQPDQPGAVPRPGQLVGGRGAAGKPDEDVSGSYSAQVILARLELEPDLIFFCLGG